MSKGYKGGDFEREVCKRLSLWWTKGERDDVFWRSSQSGGRATQRAKSGRKTYGSYGDIAAVDPIGEPLLKLVTLELKRGSSHSHPGDLLDFKCANSSHPWVKCVMQAEMSHQQADSLGWAIIARRDHRQGIIYLDSNIAKLISLQVGKIRFFQPPFFRFIFDVCGSTPQSVSHSYDFVGLRLEDFLARVTPAQIIACGKIDEQKEA